MEDSLRIFNTTVNDHISDQVSAIIQPTIEIKPFAHIVRSSVRTTTGTTAIFVTPTDKDFFLTSVYLRSMHDATSNSTNGAALTITVNGVNRVIAGLDKLTTTAVNENVFMQFEKPIQITKGTDMVFALTFTAGTAVARAVITGYTVETTKGV